MKNKNNSSKFNSPSESEGSLITLADAPNVLLEIEAKLLELDEPGTAKERRRLGQLIDVLADLAEFIADYPTEKQAA